MATPADFRSLGLSVFPSQEREIILGKQPVLADHGASVREAINKLPPEVSKALLAEYGPPGPAVIESVKDTILLREFAIENAEKGASLDHEWASGGMQRRMDEIGLSEEDPWNAPAP